MFKHVRDKQAAIGWVLSFSGAYLDDDGLPSGTLTEPDVRSGCRSRRMLYKPEYLMARNLFWGDYGKRQRTPARRRRGAPVTPARPKPEVMGQRVIVRSIEDGTETRLSPEDFQENAFNYPAHRYTVRFVDIVKAPKPTYSQGQLF
jgi:hypothetical protein